MRMIRPKTLYSVLTQTYTNFQRDGGPVLGGAIAFFALLSATPLVVVVVGIAGIAFGEDVARAEIVRRVRQAAGREAAQSMMRFIDASQDAGAGLFASLIGLVVVFWAASRLFVQLQQALNIIWGVRLKASSIRKSAARVARKRLASFGMVLLCGLALFAMLAAKTVLTAIAELVEVDLFYLLRALEFLVSVTVLGTLVAAVYKVLPDARVTWRDVWVGGMLTALLLSLGGALIGWYLGRVGPSSAYGAVGSLVVLLLWVYFAGQIFFLGASFTEVWSHRFGHGVRPESYAERVVVASRADEGLPPWADSAGAEHRAEAEERSEARGESG